MAAGRRNQAPWWPGQPSWPPGRPVAARTGAVRTGAAHPRQGSDLLGGRRASRAGAGAPCGSRDRL